MKLLRILKRESPLILAREALWRARREWNKRRLPAQLARPARLKFRVVPYYNPDLRNLSDEGRRLILDFADQIQAGRFPFLGYDTAELGARPKWNRDFVSGKEWPDVTCDLRDCIRNDGSDVKAPFELSRLQFLPVLGKAHVLSGDHSYRRAAKNLLSHWIHSNPAPVGVNWTIAMEAALRAMSICFLLNLLSPFEAEEETWLAAVTHSLAEHLLFIEANLEFSYFISSNHYLSDLVGLYCLSVVLDGRGMAARRRKYSRLIEAEMARQVFDDGGDYEASTGYQVLVTQLFTTALLLMRAEGASSPSPAFLQRLASLFRFLNCIASPSGELPHIGDCDDGRTELLLDDLRQMKHLPVAERNSLRVSGLVGLGRRLFSESGADCEGSGDDAAWYGLAKPPRVRSPETRSDAVRESSTKVLPYSGIGVLRHDSAEILFFAIPNGISGKGSHTHNDKLSFVLRLAGEQVFCDSGTACYTKDIATRNEFRGTAAHNTLMIDGTEQNRILPGPLGLFTLGNEAVVSRMDTGESPGRFLRASHAGYRSLGVTLTRTIRAIDGETAFLIEDKLEGDGEHEFELNFQIAPNRRAEMIPLENGVLCRVLGTPQVELVVTACVPLDGKILSSLISTTYGTTVPSLRLCVRGKTKVPARIISQLWWAEDAGTAIAQFESAKKSQPRDAFVEGVCLT